VKVEILPLVSDLCRFYGWTFHYVLSLPAVTFWALLKQVHKSRAAEAVQEMDMHIIPSMKFEYYEQRRRNYLQILTRDDQKDHKANKKDQLPPSGTYDWNDPKARLMIKKIFREHRIANYGR